MAEFESWRSYENFAHAVKRLSRYIRDSRAQSFLDAILATSDERKRMFRAGSIFWRAQQGTGGTASLTTTSRMSFLRLTILRE